MPSPTALSTLALLVAAASAAFTWLIWRANKESAAAAQRAATAAEDAAREALKARRESRIIEIMREAHSVVSLTLKADDGAQRVQSHTRDALVTQNSAELEDYRAATVDIKAIGELQDYARSVIEDGQLTTRTDEELMQLQSRLNGDSINLQRKIELWERKASHWGSLRARPGYAVTSGWNR